MRLAIALGLALLGAGCLGPSADEPAAAAAIPEGELARVAPDGTQLLPARFSDAPLVDEAVWTNGTFKVEQHGRLHGALPGVQVAEPTNVVRVDVSDKVPVGIPTRVIAEVDARTVDGDVDLWLEVGQGDWRTGNFDTPFGGWSRFEVGLVRSTSDPVTVVLAYDEMDQQPEFPYTLLVRVVADPTLLVNGIVSAAELPTDARLGVELVGEPRDAEPFDRVGLLVFGPDDDLVGVFPLDETDLTTIALPAGSPAGEYVFMLSQGGRNARLLVAGANATLRPLDLEWTEGEIRTGDANGNIEWTFDHARVPLLVGVLFNQPNVAMALDLDLVAPDGTALIDARVEGGPWYSLTLPEDRGTESVWGWDSGWGAPGLGPGGYGATVRFEQGAGGQPIEALDFAAFYAR